MKEQILKEAINSIKLQGEHSVNDYKFIEATISQVISKTRKEIISNIFKFMREYIKENEKLGNGNRVIIADELYAKISILIDNL